MLLSLVAQSEVSINGGVVAGGFFLFMVLMGIVMFALWVWSLVAAIKNKTLDDTTRLVWVLVIVFTGIIGSALYALFGRNLGRGASAT